MLRQRESKSCSAAVVRSLVRGLEISIGTGEEMCTGERAQDLGILKWYNWIPELHTVSRKVGGSSIHPRAKAGFLSLACLSVQHGTIPDDFSWGSGFPGQMFLGTSLLMGQNGSIVPMCITLGCFPCGAMAQNGGLSAWGWTFFLKGGKWLLVSRDGP